MFSSITPVSSFQPGLPGLQHSSQLNVSFASAESCLRNKSFRNCYEFLTTVIKLHAPEPIACEFVQRFFSITNQLQQALLDTHDYAQLNRLICVDHTSIVPLLLPFSVHHPQILSLLQDGIQQLGSADAFETLDLKREYLQRAFSLTKEKHSLEAYEFILELGKTRLQLAAKGPPESCFDSFYHAALWFNLARNFQAVNFPGRFDRLSNELTPSPTKTLSSIVLLSEGLGKMREGLGKMIEKIPKVLEKSQPESLAKKTVPELMAVVEQWYLERVTTHENSIKWANNFLWTTQPSPKRAQIVIDLAERLLDDRQIKLCRSFLSEVDKYAQRHPFPGYDLVHKQYIQLATLNTIDIDPQRPYGWQRNREALDSIRAYTRFLYLRHLEHRTCEQKPKLLLAYQDCIGSLNIPTKKVLSIFEIQDIHCALMSEFVKHLYTQAVAFMGMPPKGCKYCFVGLGSLARKEMSLYSDIDAMLIADKMDEEIRKYFECVGRYFNLLVLNLGETRKETFREGFGLHLDKAGFHLDAAGLEPSNTIMTVEDLIERQRGQNFRVDIDVSTIALRFSCFLGGEKKLFDDYIKKLETYYQSSAGILGSYLMKMWIAPPIIDDQALNVKHGLYRQITLLIDALGLQHNISATPTQARLQALNGKMPDSFLNLCERALELACRLRLSAQVHYGEAREDVYFDPHPDLKNPLLLSYEDRQTWEEINTLLFEPLRQMDLSQGINFEKLDMDRIKYLDVLIDENNKIEREEKRRTPEEIHASLFDYLWQILVRQGIDSQKLESNILHCIEKKRLAYIERLISEGRMGRAAALLQELPNAPISVRLPIAFWQGDFQQAVELNQQERPTDETFYDSLNPYRQPLEVLKTLPPIPSLNSLTGKLSWLKTHTRIIPDEPSQALFEGDTTARRRDLWSYLTKLSLSERGCQLAGHYARRCFYGKSLPNSVHELLAGVLPFPLEEPSLTDLVYVDLIEDLHEVLKVTKDTNDKAVYTYLFHRFPKEMQKRFLKELQLAQISPVLCDQLAHFPWADGSRPLLVNRNKLLNFEPVVGASESTLTGMNTQKLTLNPAACKFVQELLNGKKGQYGRHPSGHFGGLWLKLEPEFPGREFAVLTLRNFVTGSDFPMRELLKVTHNKKSFALSASLYVPGTNLQEVLLDNNSQIENLDFRSYCFDVLMTLLILPEDDKPDNFIVYQPAPNSPVQLINVDADRAFFAAMKKNRLSVTSIQCKSILLCLDQMKQPIDSAVRDEFLALEPACFFEHWLKQIDGYNHACVDLFTEKEINQRLGQAGPQYAELPFYLEPSEFANDGSVKKPGILLTLYQRFKALQNALNDSSKTTLLNLLLKVHVPLGTLYNTELQIDKRAIDRFCDLTKSEYKREKGSTVSVTTSQLRSPYKTHRDYDQYRWMGQGAQQDLKRVILHGTSDKAMREDLLQGNGVILRTLNLPRISAHVLKAVDFSPLGDELQRRILTNITGIEFEELVLRHCRVLSDPSLKAILKHCPKLAVLDLSYSTGVCKLTYLNAYVSTLETLKLNNMSTLTNLSRDGQVKLRRLELPSLKVLDLSHSPLTRVDLEARNLERLFYRSAGLPADFTLNYRKLELLAVNELSLAKALQSQDAPPIFYFGPATIRRVDRIDLKILKDITSVKFDEKYTIFRKGLSSEAETAALELGYHTCLIENPSNDSKIYIDSRNLYTGTENLYTGTDDLFGEVDRYERAAAFRVIQKFRREALLLKVLGRFQGLTSLDLSRCSTLTDAGIAAVAKSCPGLTSLDLSGCSNITDAGIRTVAEHCPGMTAIDLSGWGRITVEGIAQVKKLLPKAIVWSK